MGDKRDGKCNIVINCGDGHGGHGKKDDCGCSACDQVGGSAFVGGVDVGNISPVAVELAATLLVNPVGSGKDILILRRALTSVGSSDENVLFKFYLNPVVIANGVAAPIVNLSQPALPDVPGVSVAQLWSTPTIGASGTLIDAFNVDSAPFESTAVIRLGEGHSLLVTERANAENTRGTAFIYWTDCKVKRHHHHDEEEPEPVP